MSKLEQQLTSSKLGKVHFLELSSHLIDEALDEALQDIEVLTNTLFKIASTAKRLETTGGAQEGGRDTSGLSASVRDLSQRALGQIQLADRMQQRLKNISNILENLAKHSACEDNSKNEETWNDFLYEARKEFTMESEKILFDNVFGEIKVDRIKLTNADNSEDGSISQTHLF